MSRQFDYHAASEFPADRVFATMVDADALRARLAELGGRNAALLEHQASADGARFRVRHGLNTDDLPPSIRGFVPENFVIDRLETWTRPGEGRYDGTADVAVPGTPASAIGRMKLVDTAGGSTLHVSTDITVRVPLLGGRIESSVGEQITSLLALETDFTLNRLRTANA
jgi:Protein of unknown function (DUF2505)